jgi:hypothetical protein
MVEPTPGCARMRSVSWLVSNNPASRWNSCWRSLLRAWKSTAGLGPKKSKSTLMNDCWPVNQGDLGELVATYDIRDVRAPVRVDVVFCLFAFHGRERDKKRRRQTTCPTSERHVTSGRDLFKPQYRWRSSEPQCFLVSFVSPVPP